MATFSKQIERIKGEMFASLMAMMSDPQVINIGGGSPDPSVFPVDELATLAEQALRRHGRSLLQYGMAAGTNELKEAYLTHVAGHMGLRAAPEQLLITNGSTQGIDLVVQVLLNPGDTVLVESPTFLAIFMILQKYDVNVVPVQIDADGVVPEDLVEKMRRHKPKLFYCIPTFQNPSGCVLAEKRRLLMCRLAAEHNMFVLEDDPYYNLRYEGEAIPPIKFFDEAGRVILLNSFSKTIAPGLRVGSVLAEAEIIRKLVTAKQCTDMHTSNLDQAVCAAYLNGGSMPSHLAAIAATMAAKLDCMVSGLKQYFPSGTRFATPKGGLFIWVELPEYVDTMRLFRRAIKEKGIAFMPGNAFFAEGNGPNHFMRLNFSATDR